MVDLKKLFSFFGRKQSEEELTFISEEKIIIRRNLNILLVYLLFLVLIWFGFVFIKKELTRRLNIINDSLNKAELELARGLKAETLGFLGRIDVLKDIVAGHIYWSKIFPEIIERLTLPNVQFENFAGSLLKQEISMKGKTINFLTLAKQILSFEQSPFVTNITFGGLNIGEDGIGFNVVLSLSDKAWKR